MSKLSFKNIKNNKLHDLLVTFILYWASQGVEQLPKWMAGSNHRPCSSVKNEGGENWYILKYLCKRELSKLFTTSTTTPTSTTLLFLFLCKSSSALFYFLPLYNIQCYIYICQVNKLSLISDYIFFTFHLDNVVNYCIFLFCVLF